ncbi:MAG: outer membrane protein assembly factor BamE [Betaproteobacteria bacterium]
MNTTSSNQRIAFGRSVAGARIVLRLGTLALAATLVAGCSVLGTYMPVVEQFGIYKLDINQGNYLAQDQVDKLKVGQTPQQVRTILGTPLIISPFRPNQWDYVYEFKRQGRPQEHRNFSVYFVDDKLARWEGDEMPPSMASLNREAASKSLPRDPSAGDKGFLGWFLDIFRK